MDAAANRKICQQYLDKLVEITTVHGVYRGKIVKVDHHHVYLQPLQTNDNHKATISFFPFVIPLVLFDLLVIALLAVPFPFFW
ncbi:hypothetical protein [Ferviditalea candida]|uniref:DUF2642 domain-containing protein n=1 Tax=Ferviditalea candida TaxID=3108399 RepID=A0ABU5ZM12_9BACL|nr:hypothetical protein [Paenibacillaceae bacterium T2]